MLSGRPTTGWMDIELQCETAHIRKEPNVPLMLLLFGIWGLRLVRTSIRNDRGFVGGRNVKLFIPLRDDWEPHRSLDRNWARIRVMKLLKSLPELRQVFEEYPEARVLKCTGVRDPNAP